MDYKFQQPEDQIKFCLPLNRDTEHLYYNHYLVIDANVLTEPRVWQISKINRSNSKGVVVFTCAQELANTHTVKADYDEDGNVVAWWADWNEHEIKPVPAIPDREESEEIPDIPSSSITSTITVTGKPQFRIGGSAKTFTITFKNEEGEPIPDHDPGVWSFYIGDELLQNNLFDLTLLDDGVKIKVKFLGDDSYIGKILTVKNISEEITASLDIEILPL